MSSNFITHFNDDDPFLTDTTQLTFQASNAFTPITISSNSNNNNNNNLSSNRQSPASIEGLSGLSSVVSPAPPTHSLLQPTISENDDDYFGPISNSFDNNNIIINNNQKVLQSDMESDIIQGFGNLNLSLLDNSSIDLTILQAATPSDALSTDDIIHANDALSPNDLITSRDIIRSNDTINPSDIPTDVGVVGGEIGMLTTSSSGISTSNNASTMSTIAGNSIGHFARTVHRERSTPILPYTDLFPDVAPPRAINTSVINGVTQQQSPKLIHPVPSMGTTTTGMMMLGSGASSASASPPGLTGQGMMSGEIGVYGSSLPPPPQSLYSPKVGGHWGSSQQQSQQQQQQQQQNMPQYPQLGRRRLGLSASPLVLPTQNRSPLLPTTATTTVTAASSTTLAASAATMVGSSSSTSSSTSSTQRLTPRIASPAPLGTPSVLFRGSTYQQQQQQQQQQQHQNDAFSLYDSQTRNKGMRCIPNCNTNSTGYAHSSLGTPQLLGHQGTPSLTSTIGMRTTTTTTATTTINNNTSINSTAAKGRYGRSYGNTPYGGQSVPARPYQSPSGMTAAVGGGVGGCPGMFPSLGEPMAPLSSPACDGTPAGSVSPATLGSGISASEGLRRALGHIAELSRDQEYSRALQQWIEKAPKELVGAALEEIRPCVLKLVEDMFGNYVVQKLLEYCERNDAERLVGGLRGHVLELTLNKYGCRVVQKALDCVGEELREALGRELSGNIVKCVVSQDGNHVIQKCLVALEPQGAKFIVEEFRGHVVECAKHPYGCRVIQLILDNACADHIRIVAPELVESLLELVQDQYGNYVLQRLVANDNEQEHRPAIAAGFAGHAVKLAGSKFASNVIEMCLQHCKLEDKMKIAREIATAKSKSGVPPIVSLAEDQFGNYVVQSVLDVISHDKELFDATVSKLKPYIPIMKKSQFSKKIVTKVEAAAAAGHI